MSKLGRRLMGTAVTASLVMTGTTALLAMTAGARASSAYAYGPAESPRMIRAKDLISDEQWVAAIGELRAAAADPKEQHRDEALFWLAHSQNQVGDLAEAVESIRRLQNLYKKSRWSAPAYSLLLELAQKLGRRDVLWRIAPPPPLAPPTPHAPDAAGPPTPPPPPGSMRVKRPASPRAQPAPPADPPVTPPTPRAGPPAPAPPAEPTPWVDDTFLPDMDLRIQALGRLIYTDANKVIPMLSHIALEEPNPVAARRALFVLGQSRHPMAKVVLVDVAKKGPEPVRVAAVRELARFGGPDASDELLEVYSTAKLPVKQQVVISLGNRSDKRALFKIAESESNTELRETALIALGRAGGHEQLRTLYTKVPVSTRRAIIRGLFTARDDDGLIRLAEQEKEPSLRGYIRERLRLLGTPEAKAFLANTKDH